MEYRQLFTQHIPSPESDKSDFEKLFDLFKQILSITGGDIPETLTWMNEIDNQYPITSADYGLGHFIEDLKTRGFLQEDPQDGNLTPTSKMGQAIRLGAFEDLFGKLKKSGNGNHKTVYTGSGDEASTDSRAFRFGDDMEQIALSDSLRNAQINHGIDNLHITEDDLVIQDRQHKSQTSTVLMIDISHSMILYGEDRITPAKKVAMALAELITTRYPKDTLDILVFGNEAWQVAVKDLPYLQVGPYHTNTVAGLELAMDLLRRRKNKNKQIFMITDGKPTCIREGNQYYKNSFGLDRKILNKTLTLAAQCRRLHIPITTFMIAKDPWLQQFVQDFTHVNQGKAYFSSLNGLGDFIFTDYEQNRRKRAN